MENQTHATTATQFALRPFRVDMPEEALADLRRRIAATQWPEKETVADQSQGVQLATTQALARYWATDYDWRKCEAKLNALPQFMTEIDGLDIHFIHVRSKHENALPLEDPVADASPDRTGLAASATVGMSMPVTTTETRILPSSCSSIVAPKIVLASS